MRGSRSPRCGAALNELGIIQDGALLVRDGALIEVGPSRRLENLAEARDAVEVNAAGRVVMPGFVDCHTHLVFPPAGSGEMNSAEAARLIRATNGQRLETRTRNWLEMMARHGTTTVEVKTGCSPDESAETKVLRTLAAVRRDPLDVMPTFLFRLPGFETNSYREITDWAYRDFMPKLRRRRLARFADVAWEGASDRSLGDYLRAARSLGMPCKLHADQPNPEAAITAAVEHFATTIDHLEHATAEEAALIAGSCTVAALLPCVAFQNGGRDAPGRSLVDSGAAIAIASNFNPREMPALSMQTVVSMACMRMRLTPAEAITAATINGAHALRQADRVGSLEPGKTADALILNASDYRELGRHFGMNLVYKTMKRGELIYSEGEVAGERRAAPGAPELHS